MFFSGMHKWQYSDAVLQVLVFETPKKMGEFISGIIGEITLRGTVDYEENGLGAIYKFRAVRTGDDLWLPVIRSALAVSGGKQLWCGVPCSTPEEAIKQCKKALKLGKF